MSLHPEDNPHWQPPFCPNPKCKYHRGSHRHWPCKKNGFFPRIQHPYRIQRYTCRHCKRSFSSQTFSTTYWQKLPLLDQQIFMKTVGAMANRQIARDLRVAPSTIDRHLDRLGRHCLLFHARHGMNVPPENPLVVDGFETFELSQYYPFHHNLAVEAETSYFFYFTDSELRRKGRMTDYQKHKRQQLEQQHGRPDPKAVEKGMAELLAVALAGVAEGVVLADEHQAYRRAWRRLGKPGIRLEVTSSKEPRTPRNPLFEVNLMELLLRHGSARHRRETIAFAKRRLCSSLQLAIQLVWRNWVKWRFEKRCRKTPAMLKGLIDRPLSVLDILSERLFRTRIELPPRWSEYYDGTVLTRALPVNCRHELKYAY
jgi:transposase-like protein